MNRSLLITAAVLALAGCVDEERPVAGPDAPIDLTRITPNAPSIAYYSGLAEPERLVIGDPSTFALVWNRAFGGGAGSPPPPDVDFQRERVIVAALGQKASGGYGIEVRSADLQGGAIVVEVVSTAPGENCAVTAALTQPVDVVKIPVRTADIRFVEQSAIQDCPK